MGLAGKRLPVKVSILRAALGLVLVLAVLEPALVVTLPRQVKAQPARILQPSPTIHREEFKSEINTELLQAAEVAPKPAPKVAHRIAARNPPATAIAEPWRPRWPMVLFLVWGLGFAGFLVRMGLAVLSIRAIKKGARDLGFSPMAESAADIASRLKVRMPQLFASHRVSTPFAAGAIRPTVFLPEDFTDWVNPEQERLVLAHELVHISRHDCLWAVLARFGCALCWPNPLIWIARSQLERASEELCDRVVSNQTEEAENYAEMLVSFAERRAIRRPRWGEVGMFSDKSHLRTRVRLVLSRPGGAESATRVGVCQVIAGVGLVAVFSVFMVSTRAEAVTPVVAASKSIKSLPTFYPKPDELKTARTSDLPYIPGDFTLVYNVRREIYPPKTEEQRKQDQANEYADLRKQYQDKVTRGEITQGEADDSLRRTTIDLAPDHIDFKVVLSCRKGELYYSQLSPGNEVWADTSILRPDSVYSLGVNGGVVDKAINIGGMDCLCLPGAGFAHFPASEHPVQGIGSVWVADLPGFAGNGVMHPFDGALLSPMGRTRGLAILTGQSGRSEMDNLQIMFKGKVESECDFNKHVLLKGVPVASEFTWTRYGSRLTYQLQSSDSKALPDSAFDPAQLFAGKNVQFSTRPDNYFSVKNFDPKKGSLATQMRAVVDEKAAQDAQEKGIETMPGGAPDINPIYAAAQKRAGSNGKLVLAVTCSTTCQPCHQLAAMLKDPTIKPILDARFETVWVDVGENPAYKKLENKNAWTLVHRLDLNTGLPSYAAITPDGKVLERSGSIGYPVPRDTAVFMRVLGAGKPLSEDEKAAVETYLKAHQ